MSYRKEKKFRLTLFEFYKLKEFLNKKGLIILHKKRKISSIYYDTDYLDMFQNSEEGVLPRKKIRVRWYETNNNFNLESKTSSIEGRYKTITNLNFDSFNNLPKSLQDQLYGYLSPSLLVSYERSYFSLKGVRITFDTLIRYKNLRYSTGIMVQDPESVVEIKTNISTSDDFIENLIPCSSSRFSKYSRGVLITQKQI